MKPQTFMCIKSDAASGLVEGKPVRPYYEDSNEIIISLGGSVDHHIRKNGDYFANHLKPNGGN
ncbi:hypothetical protein [Bacillus sp. FJAT-26390]|uniref:hypothetical protein n=1 Tax=Bacillus sp. FJAT-26390 TaxID=1743142 RepID=UPI000807F3FD|nr:hypothetical protein [Bacillus sp. FJAT-26390]OBZ08020.1 hypothetical protein A7975_27205 [Bacillus sp. FJAT-26390]